MAVTTWEEGTASAERRPIYVYEWPMRAWHWTIALAISVLTATGLLVTYPVDSFGTHWPRLLHFVAGDVLAVSMLARAYWALVGNEFSRELFLAPVRFATKQFWRDLWEDLAWYALLRKKAPMHVGHNPLALVAMFGFFLLGSLFMIVSGFALYAEQGHGGWMWLAFGWVFRFCDDLTLRTYHHLGMWALLVFTAIHVYCVIRAEVMNGTTMIEAMVSGWRRFRG